MEAIQIVNMGLELVEISLLGVLVYGSFKCLVSIKELANKYNNNIEINKEKTLKLRIENFEEVMRLKFHYYFTSEIYAHFLNNQELSKQKINTLKESFYIDISKSLTEDTKNNLLEFYSIEGIKLHINQTFLRMLNDANIKYSGNDNLSKSALDAIYSINESK